MQGIAAYANQEFMPPGAIADIRGAAEMLERFGREGDVYVVHAAEGETVVPMEVLNSSPNLKKMLFTQMEEMGLSPERYIVGNELNSLNPVTGRPEFFFKNLWKSVRSIFKIAAPILGTIAMTMLLGPGGLGLSAAMTAAMGATATGAITAAAGAGIGSFVAQKLTGSSTKDALKISAFAAGSAGIMGGFNAAFPAFGETIGGWGDSITESLTGGIGDSTIGGIGDAALGDAVAGIDFSAPNPLGQTAQLGIVDSSPFTPALAARVVPGKTAVEKALAALEPFGVPQPPPTTLGGMPPSFPAANGVEPLRVGSLFDVSPNPWTESGTPNLEWTPQNPDYIATSKVPGDMTFSRAADQTSLTGGGGQGLPADAKLLQNLSHPTSTVNPQPKAPKVFSGSVDGSDWFSRQIGESQSGIRPLVDKEHLQGLRAAEASDNKLSDWVARMWDDPGKLPGEVGRYAKNAPGEVVDWVGENQLRTAMAGGLGYMAYKEAAEAERLAEEEEADRLAGNRAVYDYSQRYRDIGTNAIGYRGKSPSITLTAEHGGAIPGQGQGDIVPAMLEPGEFVMTRNAVTGAGGGSQKDGIKRMYSMMRELEGRV